MIKHVTSKSQLVDGRKESKGVALATLAVHTGAAAYILMSFLALPLSIHFISNLTTGACNPAVNPAACFSPSAHSQGHYTLIITLTRVFTFVFGNMLGATGDKFGRRPVIIFALAGYATAAACWVIGISTYSIPMFYVGGIILGICSPVTPHGVAYVSDISIPSRQAGNLGILNGFGGLFGLITGAIVSLVINAKASPPMFPSFVVGLAFTAVVALLLLILMPESLHRDERKHTTNPVSISPFGIIPVVTRNPYMFFIWLTGMCAWISAGAAEAVTANWWMLRFLTIDPAKFVSFLVFTWVCGGLGSAIMTKVYERFLGTRMSIVVSLLFLIVSGTIIAIAPDIKTSYIGAGLGFFGTPSVPSVLSVLMSQVPLEEKGLMSGTYRTSEALGKFIGSAIFGSALAAYIAPFTPDASCIPDTYSHLNKTNTCECGVESCPVAITTPTTYAPKTCAYGALTPRFWGTPSKFEAPNAAEPRQASFLNTPIEIPHSNDSNSEAFCSPPGGAGFLKPYTNERFTTEMGRMWCVRDIYPFLGCENFSPQNYGSDMAILASGNSSVPIYHSNMTRAREIFSIVSNPNVSHADVCPESPKLKAELCWVGPIGSFPGLIVLLYSTGLAALSLVFYLIAELCFSSSKLTMVSISPDD